MTSGESEGGINDFVSAYNSESDSYDNSRNSKGMANVMGGAIRNKIQVAVKIKEKENEDQIKTDEMLTNIYAKTK
jgi:hypothetical protein